MRKTRWAASLGLAVAVAVTAAGPGAATANGDARLPRGTSIALKVVTPLNSDTAVKGDTFQTTVLYPLWVEGVMALPAGSVVVGRVENVRSARAGARAGAIAVEFVRLMVPGHEPVPIKGVLTSLRDDERRALVEQHAKVPTGRKVDVIFIGPGTGPGHRASTLVGINGVDDDAMLREWAERGVGPALAEVAEGAEVAMELDSEVVLTTRYRVAHPRGAQDRNIYVSPESIRRAQSALKAAGYYKGEATGDLDRTTRSAVILYQLDKRLHPTGDLEEATLEKLGVSRAPAP